MTVKGGLKVEEMESGADEALVWEEVGGSVALGEEELKMPELGPEPELALGHDEEEYVGGGQLKVVEGVGCHSHEDVGVAEGGTETNVEPAEV